MTDEEKLEKALAEQLVCYGQIKKWLKEAIAAQSMEYKHEKLCTILHHLPTLIPIKGRPEVHSDGKTVWVNGIDGCNVGRFSKNGIDLHKDAEEQMTSGEQCFDCKPGPCNLQDWEDFKRKCKEFYAVDVTDEHKPEYLK